MSISLMAQICCLLILLTPLLAVLITACIAVLDLPVAEYRSNYLAQGAIISGLIGSFGILILLISSGRGGLVVELGDWIALPDHHFHFKLEFLFDYLSVPFLILAQVLSAVVGSFARVYLHREPGFRRFYLLYLLFVLGISISAIAGTIETLFTGWELVGLSSALLIAYFQERPSPVRNALRVWSVYRIADAAFLSAAVVFHHLAAEGDFVRMTGAQAWPNGIAQIDSNQALMVGLLLLLAAAGKSGLIPFSGWLPRAMEGPTPSSAIFYGALSVHLGAFLLLRSEAIIERSPLLCALIVILGLATSLWATLVTRVCADIKGKLACASLTQVGLIVAEIGLGLYYLALIHMIGHAVLRTLQFLRAPSLLHDYHQMENALGGQHHPVQAGALDKLAHKLYYWGYERSLFDNLLSAYLIRPYQNTLAFFGKLEQAWLKCFYGQKPRQKTRAEIELGGLDTWG